MKRTFIFILFILLSCGVSELTKGSLSSFPFFLDIDYFIPTNERKSITFEVNGRKIAVPNWKPLTEGVSIAVFEY